MALFKFDDNDIFINTLESYPEYSFYIVSGTVYIDNYPNLSGSHDSYTVNTGIGNKFGGSPSLGVPDGFISLYEYNINRPSGSIVYEVDETRTNLVDTEFGIESVRVSETDATGSTIRPFVIRDGFKHSLKTFGDSDYNVLFEAGDLVDGAYKMSASITQYNYTASTGRVLRMFDGKKSFAISGQASNQEAIKFSIRNTLKKYQFRSPHMKLVTSAPLPARDLRLAECALTNVPSIFYGKKIKPGSVELNYYVTGTLIGTLKDSAYNGELKQTYQIGTTARSGSVQGIILYNEGLIILTGSHQLGTDNSVVYVDHDGISTGNTLNKWTHFGSGLHPPSHTPTIPATLGVRPAFEIKYQGISNKETLLMMSYARQGELNWSNNPTFVDQTSPYLGVYTTSSYKYTEEDVLIANVTDTQFADYTPKQKKETYITKVAIYDDLKNLVGVATLANPVRKTEDRKYTFKLKIDL